MVGKISEMEIVMAGNNGIFREKSMERISSPERLDDYIKVANPGIWIGLSAMLLLLLGMVFWAIVGKIDTYENAVLKVDDGKVSCYISIEAAENVEKGMYLTVGENNYQITDVSEFPVAVEDEYIYGSIGDGSSKWAYELTIDVDFADGIYLGKIMINSVSPISFITN